MVRPARGGWNCLVILCTMPLCEAFGHATRIGLAPRHIRMQAGSYRSPRKAKELGQLMGSTTAEQQSRAQALADAVRNDAVLAGADAVEAMDAAMDAYMAELRSCLTPSPAASVKPSKVPAFEVPVKRSALEIFYNGLDNLRADPTGWFFGEPSPLYSNSAQYTKSVQQGASPPAPAPTPAPEFGMVVPTGAQVVPMGVVHQVKNDEATRDNEPPMAAVPMQVEDDDVTRDSEPPVAESAESLRAQARELRAAAAALGASRELAVEASEDPGTVLSASRIMKKTTKAQLRI